MVRCEECYHGSYLYGREVEYRDYCIMNVQTPNMKHGNNFY